MRVAKKIITKDQSTNSKQPLMEKKSFFVSGKIGPNKSTELQRKDRDVKGQ